MILADGYFVWRGDCNTCGCSREGSIAGRDNESREKYGEASKESKKARERQETRTDVPVENGALKRVLMAFAKGLPVGPAALPVD